jgi:hypothetical protein
MGIPIHPASLSKFPKQLRRVATILINLSSYGVDIPHSKFPHVFTDEFLFLGQFKIHNISHILMIQD